MSQKIIVPTLGESITEATITKWLKKKGDTVNADEPIVELETDKVNVEVPSPVNGVILEINSKDGETVQVGSVLGSISETEEKNSIQSIEKIVPKNKKNQNKINIEEEKTIEPKIFTDENKEKEEKEDAPLVLTQEIKKDEKIKSFEKKDNNLSPAVRRIVAEKKIDIKNIKGTGRDGRVLKGDLINLMDTSPEPNQRKIKFGAEERIK